MAKLIGNEYDVTCLESPPLFPSQTLLHETPNNKEGNLNLAASTHIHAVVKMAQNKWRDAYNINFKTQVFVILNKISRRMKNVSTKK